MLTLDFYDALVKVGINEADAKNLVVSLDAHINTQVENATKPLFDKLDTLGAQVASAGTLNGAKIDALGTSMQAQFAVLSGERDRRSSAFRWAIGTAVAVIPITLGVLKALNLLH